MRTLLCLSLALAVAPAAQPGKTVRILFLGNSYTYYNDLPLMFRSLAKAAQPELSLEVKAITEGGISLGELWHKRDVQETLDREKWDYVVLQEHSMLGWAYRDGEEMLNDPAYFWQDVQLFAPKIRKAGAQPVLYLTWSRKSKPDVQPDLDYAYATAAKEVRAKVAPVGRAWFAIRQTEPEIELYASDGSHPSLAGSYLAACVFVNTLIGARCPAMPTPVGLPAEHVAALQAAAEASDEDWKKVAGLGLPKRAGLTPANTGEAPSPPPSSLTALQGVWRGRTWMYRQPANVEVEIKLEQDQCQVTWKVIAEQGSQRSHQAARSCVVEPTGLRFVVQDWFSSAVETHQVRLQGKELVGRVHVNFRSPARAASGTWRARSTR